MKIKYMKPAPLGNVGDIADVPSDQAKVLITLGIAKPHETRKTRKRTSQPTQADYQTDTTE